MVEARTRLCVYGIIKLLKRILLEKSLQEALFFYSSYTQVYYNHPFGEGKVGYIHSISSSTAAFLALMILSSKIRDSIVANMTLRSDATTLFHIEGEMYRRLGIFHFHESFVSLYWLVIVMKIDDDGDEPLISKTRLFCMKLHNFQLRQLVTR